jgi:hypothetical protein
MMSYLRAMEKAEQCLEWASDREYLPSTEWCCTWARVAEAYLHLAELLPKDQ